MLKGKVTKVGAECFRVSQDKKKLFRFYSTYLRAVNFNKHLMECVHFSGPCV